MKSIVCLCCCLTAAVTTQASGQMIHSTAPLQTGNASFFESSSVGWSLRGENFFANFGGDGPLLPPFGDAAAGAGLSTGFAFDAGGISGSLRFRLAQGSRQTITSSAPSLTTMDGVPGTISAGVVRPFVTGLTPVVGGYAEATAPLVSAQQTAAALRNRQLNALRQSQAIRHHRKLSQYLQRAARAEAAGNKRMARANYRLAIGIAPEPLRSQLQQRLHWVMSQR